MELLVGERISSLMAGSLGSRPSPLAASFPGRVFQSQSLRSRSTRAQLEGSSSYFSDVAMPRRSHGFYKEKGALIFSLSSPLFKSDDAGIFSLSRQGTFFLEFIPAQRSGLYDWGTKQVFALSTEELGQIASLDPAKRPLSFIHESDLDKVNADQVTKTLTIEPSPDRKNTLLFNLSVTREVSKAGTRITVPISTGEYAVLRSTANYVIPYLMGWHHVTEQCIKYIEQDLL